ncbi:MAG: hypothetical protein ACE5GE_10200, partial [Phycisphaerae bacterium]
MDPLLIDADDKHRAPQEPEGAGEFGRMLRLVKPHWRFIAVGLAASLVYGMLHSISIIAMLPVLKVVLSEEGFEGWVHRVVVQDRLDAELTLDVPEDDQGASARLRLRILKVKPGSDLAGEGIRAGAVITSADGQSGPPLALLQALADAGESIELGVELPANGQASVPMHVIVGLELPSWRSSLLRTAARWVPRERTRGDRKTTLFIMLSVVVVLVVISNVTRFVARYVTAIGVLRG